MAQLPSSVHINGTTYSVDAQRNELHAADNPRDVKRFEAAHVLNEYLFWTIQLQHIVGQTVISAEMVLDEDLDALVPVIRFTNGQSLALLSDEEGKRSTWLFVPTASTASS
jgi:hypothetical protein